MKSIRALLVGAALSGLATGTDANTMPQASGDNTANTTSKKATTSKKEKHACKGQNSCKGKGGCKGGDNGCKGRNSCKGKGGCSTDRAHPMPKEDTGSCGGTGDCDKK